MDLTLDQLLATPPGREWRPLRALVAAVRPRRRGDVQEATRNLRALCHVLQTQPAKAAALRRYLVELIGSRRLVHLLTDTGITYHDGFWSAALRRLNHKWLPPAVDDDHLGDVFSLVFDRAGDHVWVCGVDDDVWVGFIRALQASEVAPGASCPGDTPSTARAAEATHASSAPATVLPELLGAVHLLSYRITNIGLEPEIAGRDLADELADSPFLLQTNEVTDYVASYRAWLLDAAAPRPRADRIVALLSKCESTVHGIRRNVDVRGVSVSLTRRLLRLEQSMARLRLLLALLGAQDATQTAPLIVACFKQLALGDGLRDSLTDLVKTNTELLALQVTKHAGRAGEHYVASSRGEWLAMLKSSAGAGVIVGFMALIKLLAGGLPLSPFGTAFVYSLNYAAGFVIVYMLHFTIATKQPAMTAALIAAAIDQGSQTLIELVELVVRVLRSQFIAIVGNVALAIPTAFAIAFGWQALFGHALASPAKSEYLLQQIDPVHSLAVPHAAIAGVCLFLSGLIAGYYDNKAEYSQIAVRLAQLRWPRRLIGARRWAGVTAYLGNNLGALAGNIAFGVMLGCMGTIGTFFGLPLDIRHITFSSANFAFGLVGLGDNLPWQQWLLTIAGLGLIGLTNLAVSFALAMWVALRSRNVSLRNERLLARLLGRRFARRPRDFFLPPGDSAA